MAAKDFPHEMAQQQHLKGMRPAKIMAPIFASNDPRHIAMSREMLEGGVVGVMLQNMAWLKAYPNTPEIYKAGVKYKPEKHVKRNGQVIQYGEEWQTIPWVIYRGYGDCEDLGAWRSAELQRKGIKAFPYIKIRRMPTGFWRAHVVVRWPDGRIEDPSAKLGMYDYPHR